MSRNYLFIAAVGIAAVSLQTTVWSFFVSSRLMPDLIFIIVLLIGFFHDPVHGAIMAFGLGYLQDLSSMELMGTFMTQRMIIFFAASILRRWVMAMSRSSRFFLALGLGFFDKLLFIFFVFTFGDESRAVFADLHLRVLEVFFNAALTLFIYPLLAWAPGLLRQPWEMER